MFLSVNGVWEDGNDPLAVHTDGLFEFAAMTEKTTPVSTDLLIIEDSEDGNNKKAVQIGNLPGGGGSLDRCLVFSDDTTLTETSTSWVTKKTFRIVRDSDKAPVSWRLVVGLVASGASEIAECQLEAVGTLGVDTSATVSVTGTTESVQAVTLAIEDTNEPTDSFITINIQLQKAGSGGTGVSITYTDVYAVY
jgi:hypothetical protein